MHCAHESDTALKLRCRCRLYRLAQHRRLHCRIPRTDLPAPSHRGLCALGHLVQHVRGCGVLHGACADLCICSTRPFTFEGKPPRAPTDGRVSSLRHTVFDGRASRAHTYVLCAVPGRICCCVCDYNFNSSNCPPRGAGGRGEGDVYLPRFDCQRIDYTIGPCCASTGLQVLWICLFACSVCSWLWSRWVLFVARAPSRCVASQALAMV